MWIFKVEISSHLSRMPPTLITGHWQRCSPLDSFQLYYKYWNVCYVNRLATIILGWMQQWTGRYLWLLIPLVVVFHWFRKGRRLPAAAPPPPPPAPPVPPPDGSGKERGMEHQWTDHLSSQLSTLNVINCDWSWFKLASEF